MKYLLIMIMSIGFYGCGIDVSSDEFVGRATIDHKIRIDISNLEYYFRLKCIETLTDEVDNPNPSQYEIDLCVADKLEEFFYISNGVK